MNQPKLITFVDAAYANDIKKRRSTTSFVFMYCVGAILSRSKTQIVSTLSSTEAKFLAAVSCAKVTLYLGSILKELGFACDNSTSVDEDNASTIVIINSQVPTEHA